MANPEHRALILQRYDWNKWRAEHPDIIPDLSNIDLSEAGFSGLDLSKANLYRISLAGGDLHMANLSGANLNEADLFEADFTGADFRAAHLTKAYLYGSSLNEARLYEANLTMANLQGANLQGANLQRANLVKANLSGANLTLADLSQATLLETNFGAANLQDAKGLAECDFRGPCVLDIVAIQRSGMLPVPFLRGCGLPDSYIEYLPSLLNQAVQFYSCFISYSTKDQEFAERLYADLQARGVRCWFAPHDIQGGRKIHEQIGAAIRVYDKLLLILSDASMNNSWVKTEIANRPRPRGTAETPDALPDHAGAVRPDQGVEAVRRGPRDRQRQRDPRVFHPGLLQLEGS